MGRAEEAIAEAKRSLELDPLSVVTNLGLETEFFYARQYDLAIDQAQKTLEMDPNFVLPRDVLGFSYLQKTMYNKAIAEFERVLVISPGNTLTLTGLGYAFALEGRRAEAQKVLNQLTEISKQKYVPAWHRAVIYAGLGEKDKAFEWLEKGFEERNLSQIKVGPVYDPLRSDPRFADLLHRMNLQP